MMPSDVKKRLGPLVDILSGFAFDSALFTSADAMPLIRIRDLGGSSTEANYLGPYRPEYVVENGDLLVGMDGDFEAVRWRGDRALLNQRVCKLSTRYPLELDQRFLYYSLIGEIKAIHAQVSATTVKHLSVKHLQEIEIRVPPHREQSAIADILTTVDRAIEQTEALIAKQRRIKVGLLHDLLTRGIDEHGRLRDPSTHCFKPSPVGLVPEEWEVVQLAHVAIVERGQFTHRPRNDPALYGGEFPFIQTGDVTDSLGRILWTFSQTLSRRGTAVSKEFPGGTIAVTIAANIADTAILGIPMYFPDSVVGVVPRNPQLTRFLEMCIRDRKRMFDSLAPQSAQKNINLQDLRPMLIPMPSENEAEIIGMVYETLDTHILLQEATLDKLQRLKTGLMQDLLSGRVSMAGLAEKAPLASEEHRAKENVV